jgi:hypothetical protein
MRINKFWKAWKAVAPTLTADAPARAGTRERVPTLTEDVV